MGRYDSEEEFQPLDQGKKNHIRWQLMSFLDINQIKECDINNFNYANYDKLFILHL